MRPGRTAVRSGRMNGAADAADAQNIEKTARRRIEQSEIPGAPPPARILAVKIKPIKIRARHSLS